MAKKKRSTFTMANGVRSGIMTPPNGRTKGSARGKNANTGTFKPRIFAEALTNAPQFTKRPRVLRAGNAVGSPRVLPY